MFKRLSTFRKWILGAALGALAAVLLAPPSSWLVRNQVALSLGGIVTELDEGPSAKKAAFAYSRWDDIPLHIAATFQAYPQSVERTHHLRRLAARFPDQPAIYASILRSMNQGELTGAKRPEENRLSGEPLNPEPPAPLPPAEDVIAAFLSDAREGARVDSDNAFFPFMESVALFAAHKDKEALEAVGRAASRPRWEEYIREEAFGQIRLSEGVYGRRPALVKTALFAAIVFPQYAAMRSSARMVAHSAIELEKQGDVEAGIRARSDLMKVGDLMRAEGRSLITTLVGRAISAIAITRPEGIRYPKTENGRKLNSERSLEIKREAYDAYLRKHGHADDAEWTKRMLDTGLNIQPVTQAAMEESAFAGRPFYRLMGYWAANLAILGNIFWLLLLAGAAALACRSRAIREGRPMTTSTKIGMWSAFILGVGLLALLGEGSVQGFMEGASLLVWTLFFALLARRLGLIPTLPLAGAALYVGLQGWLPAAAVLGGGCAGLITLLAKSRSDSRTGLTAALGTAGLTSLIVVSTGALIAWQTSGIRAISDVWALLGVGLGDAAYVFAALALSVPVMLSLLLSAVSLYNRVPLSVGLARGFRGLAVPAACLLALVYCGTLLGTLRLEKYVDAGLDATVQHEGKYLFSLAAKEWPGVTPRASETGEVR